MIQLFSVFRSSRSVHFTGAASVLCVVGLVAAVSLPAFAEERTRVLLVPPVTLGDLRMVYAKRIGKAVEDALSFSTRLTLLTDRDRFVKEDAPDATGAIVTGGSRGSKRILSADALRLGGMDLASQGKHAAALARFDKAIGGYTAAITELVDFNNLADAYARAGVAAFEAGRSAAQVRAYFADGLALQPTLIIDRRTASPKLVALLESTRTSMQRKGGGSIEVSGLAEGADLYVDGVRVGPLPGARAGLLPGKHVVQVRGEGWQDWATIVRVNGRAVRVKARPRPIPKARSVPAARVWTVGDLTACASSGGFASDKRCRKTAIALATQGGADYLVFVVIAADQYGRPTVHPFLMRGRDGRTVGLAEIGLAENLSDLNAKMTDLDKLIEARTKPFPHARALTRVPKVFRVKR